MKPEDILNAVGELEPDLVACGRTKKRRRAVRWLALAASFCLIAAIGVQLVMDSGAFRAGCSSSIGRLIDGVYYYSDDHKIWAYTPETGPEKRLSGWFVRDWYPDEYGIYYIRGKKTLRVLPHGETRADRLYTAHGCTHVLPEKYGDDVILTLYDRHRRIKWSVLLDGRTGENLGRVQEKITYDEAYKTGSFSDSHLRLGVRELELVRGEKNGCDIRENGASLLPEGLCSECFPRRAAQDALLFPLRSEAEQEPPEGTLQPQLLLTADGKTKLLYLPDWPCLLGRDGFLYTGHNEKNEVICIDPVTGEMRVLESSHPSQVEFYAIETDGDLLFASAPWAEEHECWRVEHDAEGAPVRLTLIDGDIRD